MTNEKFLILEASAGSGKTHNLAKRYISLLLNFDGTKNQKVPLKNILALTFTNKATVEMKERIIEYLKKISLEKDTENITDSIKLPQKQIVINAAAAMEAIIYDFDKFNVNTIDSFINLVIKACALKIGFSPNYSIVEKYDEYLNTAIESFLDNSLTNENKKLLDNFFLQYITDANSSWNITKNITKCFKSFYDKDRTVNTDIPDINYDETLLNYSHKFYECCSEMIKIKEFENIKANISSSVKKINTHDYLLKNINDLRKFFEYEEIQYRKNTEHNSRLDNLFISIKKLLKDFVEFKAEHFYDNYIKIFSNIIYEFNKKAKEDSVMFLQNINKKIEELFTDNEQSMSLNEVYCRLSDRFTDLLIDEFQDTNKLQWKAIKPIAEENLSQNGSFFYVGDKKQAIYGFRGGDSAIFNIPLKGFMAFNPKMIPLNTNYRSCRAVIDMNNEVFSPENLDSFIKAILEKEKFSDINKEYYNDIIETFKTSKQLYSGNKKEPGYIEIQRKYISADTDEESQNEDIIKEYLYKTIESVKERFDYKNIAVLCRKATDIEKVGRWLLDKGINIESYVTLNILRSDIIKEIFSALKFLANPEDKISFVSFITGKIFLKHTGLSACAVDEFIIKNKNSKFLYIAFRENFKDIWNKNIESFFNSAGFIAVYELTVAFISKYKVIENFPEYSNIILRFLEIINIFINKENENHSLQKFTEFFSDFEKNGKDDSFFVKVPSSDAVKITTVHKAKGLQFDVVIMPYFYIDIKSPPPYDDNGNFLCFTKPHIKYSQKLKDIYAKNFFKSVSDELNIIYVSMTRAVYEFHGLIVEKELKKPEDKKSSISYLIPESMTSKGEKVPVVKKETEKQSAEIVLNPDNLKDITEVLTESTVEIYGKNKAEMLLKGEMFHYAMANIISFNINNKQTAIDKALELTKLQYPDEDLSDIAVMINNLLSVEEIAKLFSEKYEIYNEQEFIDSFGNTIRPDKLIITDSEIIILDYKTSIYDEESIKEQMHKYINAVRDVWKYKTVKAFIADIQNCMLTEIK